MAVPRRPHQPRAPRTTRASRISTHAATRAPQHTSHCSLRPLHKRLHLLQAPYRTGARRDRQDASPRGARGGTPRAAAAAHTPRHPTRSAAQPASSCAADLLDTQHTRTLVPPAHCAADCTPRQLRSTRRGARGTPRALPGGSAKNDPCLCGLCSLTLCNNTLTHARAAHALRDPPSPEKTAALQHK